MSEQGDRTLVATLRGALEKAMDEQKTILVSRTSDRLAGYIQGLEAALGILNNEVRTISEADRPNQRNT